MKADSNSPLHMCRSLLLAPVKDMDQLRECIITCIARIESWIEVNRLALNPTKKEVLWITTPRRKHLINHEPFQTPAVPSAKVRLLGALLDKSLSSHVCIVTRNAFYHLWQITKRYKDICRRQQRRYSCGLQCLRDWTIATAFYLDYLTASSIACRWSRMLLHE